jgi:release factor glutamine methyltransferase
VSGIELGRLPIAPDLSDAQVVAFDAAVARRCAGEPLQHITGVAWFRTTSLTVGPGVFVPRPETETMTGWCLEHLEPGQRVVELCAGSGAISKALAVEGAGYEQWAVELAPDAVSYLIGNLSGTDVRVVEADMAEALPELDGTVDLVVVNPPYVPLDAWESVPADVRDHDPELAVFSGADGLDAMHVVARVAARLLKPSGLLAAEHAEVQHEQVVGLFARHGSYDTVRDNQDLVGRWRFVTARRRG